MSSADVIQEIVEETRARFVSTFAEQCVSIRNLVDQVDRLGSDGPVEELTHVVHRLAGLAGTIGFPTISVRASELERLVDGVATGGFDGLRARILSDALHEAFTHDLAHPPPARVSPVVAAAPGALILVAEDDLDQQRIVTAYLSHAGYSSIAVASGDLVIDRARTQRPALILLDIALPKVDGYSVCRKLKADPDLSGVPVILMTTGVSLDDKLTGLALGAAEFLTKPVDLAELVLRIQLLLRPGPVSSAQVATHPGPSKTVPLGAFLSLAGQEIDRPPVAVALMRLPEGLLDEVERVLTAQLRGRDAIGACGPTHLLMLFPAMTAIDARDTLTPLIEQLISDGRGAVHVGVTEALNVGGGLPSVKALIGQADEALAQARHMGHPLVIWGAPDTQPRPDPLPPAPAPTAPPYIPPPAASGVTPAVRTVLIAEDDPDITRLIDAQLRAAGYRAIITFDGEEALAAVRAHAPDVLVLDLMMPKLSGFELLEAIRATPPPRPRIIIVSGRGREEDVVRAFDLGADDYVTKPFSTEELMARIARLFRSPNTP